MSFRLQFNVLHSSLIVKVVIALLCFIRSIRPFADTVAVYQLICTYAVIGKVCPERVVIYHNITYLIL